MSEAERMRRNPAKFDWRQEWCSREDERRKADDAGYWDSRAKAFRKSAGQSSYRDEFLALSRILPGETVFDMGAGSGVLTLPLAEAGHRVIAADFSAGMLEALHDGAIARSEDLGENLLDRIETHQVSWEGDWDAAGIPEKVADVALASRSIAVYDLEAALIKLESRAKRRVCLTLTANASPRYDDRLWRQLGREPQAGDTFVLALNMLFDLGREPELAYIRNGKLDAYASEEAARAIIRESLLEVAPSEEAALECYFKEHLTTRKTADGETVWTRDYPMATNWAFISWNI